MNTWQLIREILHGVDFYWRKFLILCLILVLGGAGIFFWKSYHRTSAEFLYENESEFSTVQEKNFTIDVKNNGQILVNGEDASHDLLIYPDYYQVQVMLADQSGSFIDHVRAQMNLPVDVSKDQIQQIIYAIHGVGATSSSMQNGHTLVFEADEVESQATLSIAARLPKTILTPSIWRRLGYYLANISVNDFTFVAAILPLVTLLVMLFMIIKRRQDQIISFKAPAISQPPAKVPPAIPGALIDGQVGAREIAATLIDLANRGYIYIIRKNNYFSFGKRKSMALDKWPDLKPFEQVLLSKIFSAEQYKSTKDDVELRVGHHIFSRKIAKAFLEIYNETTELGYFIKNPAAVHRRWRYTGIGLLFLGVLGFFYTALWGPDPKFALFFWVGEMATSSVIIKLSGLMPTRSAEGSQMLNKWMAFRRYLKLKAPIEPAANVLDNFNKFLPLAIVFGVEVEWAKRFMKTSFSRPEWYESEEAITSLEDYINGLFPLISFVGQILAGSHEPTVE